MPRDLGRGFISLMIQNYRPTIVFDVNEGDNRKLIFVHHIFTWHSYQTKKEEKQY